MSATSPRDDDDDHGDDSNDDDDWAERAQEILLDSDWAELGDCDGDDNEAVEAHNDRVRAVLAKREEAIQNAELLEDVPADAAGGEGEGEGEGEDQVAEDEGAEDEGADGAAGGAVGPRAEAGDAAKKGKKGKKKETESETLAVALDALKLEDVIEPYVVKYGRQVYGVPGCYILLEATDALEFATRDEYNSMWNSKAAAPFIKRVRPKHVSVLRSDQRTTPDNWVAGMEGDKRTLEDFPYKTFMYIRSYVKADDDDPESEVRAEHDKRLQKHLYKAVASGLHKSFMQLDSVKNNEERRKHLKPLIDWVPPGPPQVKPDVVAWPAYEGLELETAYIENESKQRPIGPNSKKAPSGAADDDEVMPAPPARVSGSKRGSKAVVDQEGPSGSDADGASDETLTPSPNLGGGIIKRTRYIDVRDWGKTTVHVVPGHNQVAIIEYH